MAYVAGLAPKQQIERKSMNPSQSGSASNGISRAWGRALLAQFRPKMLFLSLLPAALAIGLWAIVLGFSLNYLISLVQTWFEQYDLFKGSSSWLATFGALTLKTVLVPILAMWAILPLMILTSLIFMGLIAMPAVIDLVAKRDFPELERKQGGSLLGSVGINLGSSIQFCVLWIISLPFCLIPMVTMILHPLLLGWLTYRVMSYDALAEHASVEERKSLMQKHRWRLSAIGSIGGLLTSLPSVILLNGGSFVFPFLAIVAIWLYVLVFIFIGLWFEYYCLDALQTLRGQQNQTKLNTQSLENV